MRITTTLAFLVLMAAPVLAQQGNVTSVDQDGTDNLARIDQVGDGNLAGIDERPLLQDGFFNQLDIEQTGTANTVGDPGLVLDGVALGLYQLGRDGNVAVFNSIDILQSTNRNTVGAVDQRALGSMENGANTLVIRQSGGDGNTVDLAVQTQLGGEAAQSATVTQTGRDNVLTLLEQRASTDVGSAAENRVVATFTGDRNGAIGLALPFGLPIVDDSTISQEAGNEDTRGNGNMLDLSITGNDTRFGTRQQGSGNGAVVTIVGDQNQFGMRQDGDANQATVTVTEGDANLVGLDQFGTNVASIQITGEGSDDNLALVVQRGTGDAILTITGASSDIEIRQGYDSGNGGRNDATVAIVGDQTFLRVDQRGGTSGAANVVNLRIVGDRTNRGIFTLAGSTLTPGEITQIGNDNSVEATIEGLTVGTGGEDNVTAMLQQGDLNAILLTVRGDSNESEFLQLGDRNSAVLQQIGTGNRARIRQ
jgi:hypothetical protein